MKRNTQNKGNAEWQRLLAPRPTEKVKLRLTLEDAYAIADGKAGFREGGPRRTGGPVKEGGNR